MWLINTTSLELEHFFDPETDGVRYAILSHTWGQDEVSFQEFADLQTARSKAGFAKIEKTCELARSEGYAYAWVDTCCINKSSSAELSEAINSMFSWYRASAICYAHLSDLNGDPFEGLPRGFETMPKGCLDAYRTDVLNTRFSQCVWFTRGWTLQELIAPPELDFYDGSWRRINDKRTLRHLLKIVTNINTNILMDNTLLLTKSVWRRMSWAANRQTTRTEDTAYSLLGIFDVNIPLIYGEGYMAFQRLQEEITRKEGDSTIFLWSSETMPLPRHRPVRYRNATVPPPYTGAFAWAPSQFLSRLRYAEVANAGSDYYWSHVVMPAKVEMGSQSSAVIRDGLICDVSFSDHPRGLYLEFSTAVGVVHRRIEKMPSGYAFVNAPITKLKDVVQMAPSELQEIRVFGQHTSTLLDASRQRNIHLSIDLVDQRILSTNAWPLHRWDQAQLQWHYTDHELLRLSNPVPTIIGLLVLDQAGTGHGPASAHTFACAVGIHGTDKSDGDGVRDEKKGKLPRLFGLCLTQASGNSTKAALRSLKHDIFDTKDLRLAVVKLQCYLKTRDFCFHSGRSENATISPSDTQRARVSTTCHYSEILKEATDGILRWTLQVDMHMATWTVLDDDTP